MGNPSASLVDSLEFGPAFALLSAANPIPAWLVCLNTWRFLEANAAAILHYGYSYEEFLGMYLPDLCPDEDILCFIDYLADHNNLPPGKSCWRHRLKGGRLIEAEIVIYRIPLHDLEAAVVLACDRSQTRQAEEQTASLLALNQRPDLTVGFGALLKTLAREAIGLLQAEGGWIGTREPGNAVAGDILKMAQADVESYSTHTGPLTDWLWQHKAPYMTNAARMDSRIDPVCRQRLGIRTLLAVPIVDIEGEGTGLIAVYNKLDRSGFTETDKARLMAVAQAAAAAQQKAHGHQQLLALSRALMERDDADRRRLALELHDEIGQALTAIMLNLRATKMTVDPALAALLEESITLTDATLDRVHNLALDLRPPQLDDLGLEMSLRRQAAAHAQRAGFAVRFADPPLSARVPPDVATACLRVGQEALTNVVRHARAQQVTIHLQFDEGDLELVVEDDGMGFDVADARHRALRGASLGLLGMEERAHLTGGRVDITSAPGQGTTVRARWPLRARRADAHGGNISMGGGTFPR